LGSNDGRNNGGRALAPCALGALNRAVKETRKSHVPVHALAVHSPASSLNECHECHEWGSGESTLLRAGQLEWLVDRKGPDCE